jgi:hypothetical protein
MPYSIFMPHLLWISKKPIPRPREDDAHVQD